MCPIKLGIQIVFFILIVSQLSAKKIPHHLSKIKENFSVLDGELDKDALNEFKKDSSNLKALNELNEIKEKLVALNKKKPVNIKYRVKSNVQMSKNQLSNDLEKYRMIQRMIFSFGRKR
jgi:hypothetical protein